MGCAVLCLRYALLAGCILADDMVSCVGLNRPNRPLCVPWASAARNEDGYLHPCTLCTVLYFLHIN